MAGWDAIYVQDRRDNDRGVRLVGRRAGEKKLTHIGTFDNTRAATQQRRELLRSGDTRGVRTGRQTLAGYVDESSWVETRRQKLAASSFAAEQQYLTGHVLPRWGDIELRSVEDQAGEIQEWVNGLDLAADSKGKALRVLRSILEHARTVDRLIQVNPAAAATAPPVRRETQKRALTLDEVEALIELTPARWEPLIVAATYSGCRFSELVGLQVGDVDVDRGVFHIQRATTEVQGRLVDGPPKSAAGRRTIPIPRLVTDQLAELVDSRDNDERVFTAAHGGPLRYGNFRRRVWYPLVDELTARAPRLEGLGFHELRHTAITNWILVIGAAPLEVKTWAGHSSINVTYDVYGHLWDDVSGAAVAGFDSPAADVVAIRRGAA